MSLQCGEGFPFLNDGDPQRICMLCGHVGGSIDRGAVFKAAGFGQDVRNNGPKFCKEVFPVSGLAVHGRNDGNHDDTIFRTVSRKNRWQSVRIAFENRQLESQPPSGLPGAPWLTVRSSRLASNRVGSAQGNDMLIQFNRRQRWLLLVSVLVCSGVQQGCGQAPVDPDAPTHGFLGIILTSPNVTPVVIEGFVPDSPAATSGLQLGDRLLRVARQRQPTHDQLEQLVQELRPDDRVGVRVARGEEELEYEVTLVSFSFVQQAMRDR